MSGGPRLHPSRENRSMDDWDDDEGYQAPHGADPVLDLLRARGMPLTRQAYLEFNYPDGVPDPLPGEIAGSVPRELRDESEAVH